VPQPAARPPFCYDGPEFPDSMMRLATVLAGARHLPSEFKGSPADLVYVMVTAKSLDVPLGAAIQQLFPGSDPDTGASSGLEANAVLHRAMILRAGYHLRYPAHDDDRCVIELYAPGSDPETDEPLDAEEYTYADAEASGLPGRNPWWWEFHRARMLLARATTNLSTRAVPHLTLGLIVAEDAVREQTPRPPADGPAPAQGPAQTPASPLQFDLDAATADYDPASSDEWPAPVPVNLMRPDRAVTAARQMVGVALQSAQENAKAADEDPSDPVRAESAERAARRLSWARERLHWATRRAQRYLDEHGPDAFADHLPPAPAITPAPAPRDPRGPEDLSQRTRTPEPAQDPGPAPGTAAPSAPAPAPTTPPAPKAPAKKTTAPKPTAKKTAAKPGTGAKEKGVRIGQPVDADGRIARARALLSEAAEADTAAKIGKIYKTAREEDVLNVPLDGQTLERRLMDRVRELQDAAPEPTRRETVTAAAPAAPDRPDTDRARALLAEATAAKTPAAVSRIYETASREKLQLTLLDGRTLKELLSSRADDLGRSRPPKAPADPSAERETGPADPPACTCDAIELMGRNNRHEPPCPVPNQTEAA
jgi:hypothetical protein